MPVALSPSENTVSARWFTDKSVLPNNIRNLGTELAEATVSEKCPTADSGVSKRHRS